MRYFITGGSGFIGGEVSKRLKGDTFNFDVTKGYNLTNKEQVFRSIRDFNPDLVLHIAAIADLNYAQKYPTNCYRTNIEGTHNIANACWALSKPMIYISTCCVYGHAEVHPSKEEHHPHPAEIYAYSKYAGENIVNAYETLGLEKIILRLPTTYGPGMRSALGVHIFFMQALKGQPITVHGTGLQVRTLTYIDDVVDGICRVALNHRELKGNTFNISAKEQVSALEMAEKIKALTNSKSDIIHIEQRKGQVFEEQIDTTKIKEATGWEQKISFDEGLMKTHDWMKAQVK